MYFVQAHDFSESCLASSCSSRSLHIHSSLVLPRHQPPCSVPTPSGFVTLPWPSLSHGSSLLNTRKTCPCPAKTCPLLDSLLAGGGPAPMHWHGKQHPSHLLPLMAPVAPGDTSETYTGHATPFHPSLFAHACCSLGQRELPQAPPLELSTRQLSLTHWNSVCKWKGFSSLLTLLWFAQCFRHQ